MVDKIINIAKWLIDFFEAPYHTVKAFYRVMIVVIILYILSNPPISMSGFTMDFVGYAGIFYIIGGLLYEKGAIRYIIMGKECMDKEYKNDKGN